jgi:serine/threonine protein kinase
VAIKIIDKSKLSDPNEAKRIQREIRVLKRLSHSSVIKLFEVLDAGKWHEIPVQAMGQLFSNVHLLHNHLYYCYKMVKPGGRAFDHPLLNSQGMSWTLLYVLSRTRYEDPYLLFSHQSRWLCLQVISSTWSWSMHLMEVCWTMSGPGSG